MSHDPVAWLRKHRRLAVAVVVAVIVLLLLLGHYVGPDKVMRSPGQDSRQPLP
ncbi:MAG: hypothetical protein R6X20_04360 [Phycisphaerae bacterium]